MKRDWNLLRQILINVEEERDLFFGLDDGHETLNEMEQQKEAAILLGHLELLTVNGFICDVKVLRTVGGFAGMSSGHTLSHNVWPRPAGYDAFSYGVGKY